MWHFTHFKSILIKSKKLELKNWKKIHPIIHLGRIFPEKSLLYFDLFQYFFFLNFKRLTTIPKKNSSNHREKCKSYSHERFYITTALCIHSISFHPKMIFKGLLLKSPLEGKNLLMSAKSRWRSRDCCHAVVACAYFFEESRCRSCWRLYIFFF